MSNTDKKLQGLGYTPVFNAGGDRYDNFCEKTGVTQSIIFDDNLKTVWIPIFNNKNKNIQANLCANTIEVVYDELVLRGWI